MFDESAAVPAAEEYAAFTDEAQPLGPYSCTVDEAGGWVQGAASARVCFADTSIQLYLCRAAGGCMKGEGLVQRL
jgi:hypothetical protein